MTNAVAVAGRRQIVIGALMMVCATFCFTALDSILKLLSTRHDVVFLVFARYLCQLACLVALMPVFGVATMMPRHAPLTHMARGALLVATTVLIVLSLRVLPMAQTYAITFGAPLIAVMLAWLFLGERVSFFRVCLIVAGFAGVLIALRPDAPGAGLHLLLPLGMAFANAAFHVMTRSIAAGEEPLALVFSACAVALVLTSLALPWHWGAMDGYDWGLMALGGAFGTMAHVLLAQAFRVAPTGVVSPMIYTQIISACALGYFVFAEVPSVSTLVGSVIVAASGIALVWSRR